MKRLFKNIISIAVFVSVILSFASCSLIRRGFVSAETPPNVNDSNNNYINNGNLDGGGGALTERTAHIDENSLIGIAAFKEFDKSRVDNLSNKAFRQRDGYITKTDTRDNGQEDYLKVSYPYDYVKIVSAYKFTINVPDIADSVSKEIIEENCGLGEIEVVVADFETYIDMNGYMQPSVQDTLISLRGYNGYYTILANSGARTDDSFMFVFSSHKRLTDEDVSKDFTPPILSIFLKEEGNSRYVYFETSDNLLSFGNYDSDSAFKNIDVVQRISRSTVYSVLELTSLPIASVTVSVVNIDLKNGVIEVLGNCNLTRVLVDERTEGASLQEILLTDSITVEYDLLFDKYDPACVTANSITVKKDESFAEVQEA